ncbi:transglycosylase domain-containing protein [Arthrobacter sp. ERGS1:01]|uniref:transglycosylase domain-containing protein n=1 Tax=Arthrobacter sp. ERGS1:01 TaxID=1704044 RepID=UPI001ED9ACA8|nr:transglycosylase domain-containing protein [Arthrobacter sp. ERGS1:01]
MGNLLKLFVVCGLCGVLVAALLVPAGAAATAAVSGTDSLLANMPSTLALTPPAQATKVLANDGSTIATFYAQDREAVSLANMSPFIRNGIVSIEDARFYEHGGIDPTGILRALVATVQGGREGASTITQQYVNNVIIEQLVSNGKTDAVKLGQQKTVGDKLTEMKLAIGLEKEMTKDQILQGYLNIIYFGNGAYGIQAAAKLYFNTNAKNLTLPQAAALAGVVNSPTFYDPLTQPAHVVDRRNDVLAKMLQQGKISKKSYTAAVKAPLTLHVNMPQQGCVAAATAPYFCDYVQQLVVNDKAFGATPEERTKFLYQGGLTIRTTLDPKLQKVAQDQVNGTISATDPLQRGAAVVSVQPGTGKVLTMAQNTIYNPADKVGNYMGNFALPINDANGNPLDGAGGFQIGSTFKPFVFAEWLNSGHSMMTTINGAVRDYPIGYPWKNSCGSTTGSYDPVSGTNLLPNDDPDHYYPMTAYLGLAISINTVTFQTASQLDFCNIQKMATAAGVKDGHTNKPYDLSSIANLIGTQNVAPIDMATAFATFASGGVRCEPIALTSITDANGKKYPVPGADCQRTMSKEVAAGVTYALHYMLTNGSGYAIPLNNKDMSFAKTGTSDGNIQTWTVGANSGVATAAWFGSYKGYADKYINQDLTINGVYYPNIDGNQLAGSNWAAVMNAAADTGKYDSSALVQPPAEMLSQTAPLVAGVNDPMGNSGLPTLPQNGDGTTGDGTTGGTGSNGDGTTGGTGDGTTGGTGGGTGTGTTTQAPVVPVPTQAPAPTKGGTGANPPTAKK